MGGTRLTDRKETKFRRLSGSNGRFIRLEEPVTTEKPERKVVKNGVKEEHLFSVDVNNLI